jgi:hypothetical protein
MPLDRQKLCSVEVVAGPRNQILKRTPSKSPVSLRSGAFCMWGWQVAGRPALDSMQGRRHIPSQDRRNPGLSSVGLLKSVT